MKGQILGFDGETGAITGEDGNRYSFALADWKGEKAPQPRDSVDFVAKEGAATEIYKVSGSFNTPSIDGVSETLSGVGASLSEAAENIDTGKLDYLRTRPKLILIGIAILAFFFFNLLSITGNGVSAFSLPSELSEAAAVTGIFGRGDDFSASSTAGRLLWLIPLGGAFVIFREVTGKSTRIGELVVAGACFFSFMVYAMVVASFENLVGGYQRFDQAISLGFGGYIFLLCGVGLILTAFGIVKTVPGWKAPEVAKSE